MKSDKIRVGIIGTGRISDLHVTEYINNHHTDIVALCDNNIDHAKEKAKIWNLADVNIYDDYPQLLAMDNVDLVEILVPHHLHKEVTLSAIENGKMISLQKPMCMNIDDASELIDAASQAKILFKVFENFIFYPPVMKAKSLIEEDAIGKPLTIRIKSNPGKSKTAWDVPIAASIWRQDIKKSGGGPLVFDDGHHKFSLAWHFMGQAEEVHAWISETELGQGFVLDSPAMVSFKFPENRYGNLEVVYSPELEINTRHYAQDDRIEITGTKGVIWINQGHGSLGNPVPVSLYRDGVLSEFPDVESGWETSFIHSTRHFIDAIMNGLPPKLTGEEGLEVLKFTLAAQESARSGKVVTLD